jgi:hypothetical protein
MRLCLFLSFRAGNDVSLDSELARLPGVLQAVRGLRKALIHTASRAYDPYLDDGAPPRLVLQLYFDELPDLEASLARDGSLNALLSTDAFPQLAKAEVTQQAMLVRPVGLGALPSRIARGEPYCTYLVSYEGEAEDLNAWLSHYLSEHTRYMAEFPDVRELEVYTRIDWVSALPWRRVHHMQRNKVAFDNADALTRALNSPVRHRMREDYKTFPPFMGANTHYAMTTRVVGP